MHKQNTQTCNHSSLSKKILQIFKKREKKFSPTTVTNDSASQLKMQYHSFDQDKGSRLTFYLHRVSLGRMSKHVFHRESTFTSLIPFFPIYLPVRCVSLLKRFCVYTRIILGLSDRVFPQNKLPPQHFSKKKTE